MAIVSGIDFSPKSRAAAEAAAAIARRLGDELAHPCWTSRTSRSARSG
jgi:hypothetical protein